MALLVVGVVLELLGGKEAVELCRSSQNREASHVSLGVFRDCGEIGASGALMLDHFSALR